MVLWNVVRICTQSLRIQCKGELACPWSIFIVEFCWGYTQSFRQYKRHPLHGHWTLTPSKPCIWTPHLKKFKFSLVSIVILYNYIFIFLKKEVIHPMIQNHLLKNALISCPKLKTSTLRLLNLSLSHILMIRKMLCFSYVSYEVSFYISLAIQMIYWLYRLWVSVVHTFLNRWCGFSNGSV